MDVSQGTVYATLTCLFCCSFRLRFLHLNALRVTELVTASIPRGVTPSVYRSKVPIAKVFQQLFQPVSVPPCSSALRFIS